MYKGQLGTSTVIEKKYKENICKKCPNVRLSENKISWYCVKLKKFDTKKVKCQFNKLPKKKKNK